MSVVASAWASCLQHLANSMSRYRQICVSLHVAADKHAPHAFGSRCLIFRVVKGPLQCAVIRRPSVCDLPPLHDMPAGMRVCQRKDGRTPSHLTGCTSKQSCKGHCKGRSTGFIFFNLADQLPGSFIKALSCVSWCPQLTRGVEARPGVHSTQAAEPACILEHANAMLQGFLSINGSTPAEPNGAMRFQYPTKD